MRGDRVQSCPVCGVHVTAQRGARNVWLGWVGECPQCGLILEWDRHGFLVAQDAS